MIPPLSLPADSLFDNLDLDFVGGGEFGCGGEDWSSITSTVVGMGVPMDDRASGFSVPGVLTASGSGNGSVRDVRW